MLGVVRRNPQFRRIWLAQVVSQAGDWLNKTAVLALIGELSGGAQAAAMGSLFGIELALRLLPTAALSPVAGPVADRVSRRALMVASDLLRAGIVLMLLTVDQREELPRLYVLVAAQMSLAIFFDAARSAAIPSTVPAGDLAAAHTLSAVTWSTMLALGAFLGGVVLVWIGPAGVFLVDAGTYVGSALLLGRLRLPPTPAHPAPFRWRDVLLAEDLRRALAHVRALGLLPVLLAKTFWGMAGGFLVLLSVLGTERFGGDVEAADAGLAGVGRTGFAIGLLYAARGVGTGLGPVLARRLTGQSDRAFARAIVAGFVVAGLGYAALPLAPSLGLACLLVALAHMGGSTIWVSSTVFWQRRVEDAYRGRVHSLDFLGMTLSFTLWGGAIGALRDASGSVDLALWVTAAAALLGGLAWRAYARGLALREDGAPLTPAPRGVAERRAE